MEGTTSKVLNAGLAAEETAGIGGVETCVMWSQWQQICTFYTTKSDIHEVMSDDN